MSRAKRKRKNAMKRHQTQTIEVNVDMTPMVQSAIEGLKVSLQPSIDQWAQQLAQSVVNQATAAQEDPADYAPLPNLDETDDDDEVPDVSHEDGESMGEDEDTDAWQEDEKLAYGDDWDGLGNEDDEDDDDDY
ncbi:MAG: hypothetical protein LKJ29_08695 [Lactobacillus sp.]|uniref:DNA primase n=1 Tax=Lacticaseibacillus suilingensis TaxID=2799577 RepID=A0ABW4BI55_9LACO|nr:hypothetical protein [Lacticaseibacillus suilingensis]MCI1895064.1 hypothetical protein [Lactobacillus sp.]MCI1918378.1 hypothetical protein [Lactobacillus sp.]MCI1942115.1 hypothetical protein [Lactobacillus sp.]MCI1972498.1 hypothetical protein [Lactobacillus sp.]MCI2017210.1 hypothetical protein [Lactobacillus sp.]